MFETFRNGEVLLPGFPACENEHYWNYCEMSSQEPWFYLVYSKRSKAPAAVRSFITADAAVLMSHLLDSDTCVREAYLVSPSHINQSKQWKMEALKGVCVGHEPDSMHQIAYLYELHNGSHYVFSELATVEADLVDVRRLIEFQ